jgi:ferric iron reductase protein FhuF
MEPWITTALNLLYEAFKALHKDDIEKFEKEWKKDEQDFLEALQAHDSARLAQLISKYSGLL